MLCAGLGENAHVAVSRSSLRSVPGPQDSARAPPHRAPPERGVAGSAPGPLAFLSPALVFADAFSPPSFAQVPENAPRLSDPLLLVFLDLL